MAITYVGDLSTNLDKVRFYIQDTADNGGPKPGSGAVTNFTDDELNGLITAEGSWQRAVAAALETLASLWGQYADITVGPRKEAVSQIAKRYESLARTWRGRHGGTAAMGYAFVTRVDGYSDDVAADEV